MYKMPVFALAVAVPILLLPAMAWAADPSAPVDGLAKALTDGKLLFDARYRFEYVDQDGLPADAKASTLRTRLGYETGKFHNFGALVEAENISVIGAESYNDTINGKVQYPIVGDIESTQLNRAYLSYTGLPQTNIIAGRQTMALDNQRWVGAVAWRQNDQTHDAISIANTSLNDTSLFYAHSWQVNRTLGERSPLGTWNDSDIDLFNASYSGFQLGKLSAYGYLLDIPDMSGLSTATYGIRLESKQPLSKEVTALYAAEYARQSDYAGNPGSYDLDYYMLEPGIGYGPWTIKALYESIEGNGTQAVQFPIATLHAFNGWADKFTTTPATGLVDMALSTAYTAKSDHEWLNGTKFQLTYHDFSAEQGSADYGTEWNALIERSFANHYTVGIKYANYQADGLFTDTVKIMPYIQVKFP